MSKKYTDLLRKLRLRFVRKGHQLNFPEGLSHKGSSYKGKGQVNSDSKIFNKRRKG